MIQSFSIENFKSFRKATLPLAPLTLLIGANASGKSNAIEAIQLLAWLASGKRLGELPSALREQEIPIRGASRDLTFEGSEISFGCEIGPEEDSDGPQLLFSTALDIGKEGIRISKERLDSPDLSPRSPLYQTVAPAPAHGEWIEVVYNSFARGRRPRITCTDQQAIFTQIGTPARFESHHGEAQMRIPAAAATLRRNLRSLLFLDPNPRRMREYSFVLERKLQGDGGALSSVLQWLIEEDGEKDQVLRFIRALPEQDIREISFLGTPRNEVMVMLHETFGGRETMREAALLSDGTLRVLAVAAALLSVLPGSTVVIEEIDNGVHPSRAESLLQEIQRIAQAREIQVLLTTHNPALLDALPPEAIPNVVACYRDPKEGDSRLIRLEELESYPELVAQGPIGSLVTRGILDRFLKDPDKRDNAVKVEKGLAWLSDFKRRAKAS
ncbi:MAG TPA: ATP-binding protein [Thermoanaerobaculia bacterium]|nr:ATP-binding protein [Thermoanaerobaculia bacterium]